MAKRVTAKQVTAYRPRASFSACLLQAHSNKLADMNKKPKPQTRKPKKPPKQPPKRDYHYRISPNGETMTQSIYVRLPTALRTQFYDRLKSENRSVSIVIRSMIEAYIAG